MFHQTDDDDYENSEFLKQQEDEDEKQQEDEGEKQHF